MILKVKHLKNLLIIFTGDEAIDLYEYLTGRRINKNEK